MTLGKITQLLTWMAYPAIIFFGLKWLEPRIIAIVLGLLLILRWHKEAKHLFLSISRVSFFVFVALLVFIITITITNNEALLRLYPALISLGMLLVFVSSLIFPPSMIEQFARLQQPNLSKEGVYYTKRVTQVWCLFFVLNGSFAVYTAFYTSLEIWSLYNGLIAYVLIGLMFIGEWLVRRHYMNYKTEA